MTIVEAMAAAIELAKSSGFEAYVHEVNSQFVTNGDYDRNYIAKIYPGGRKVLSVKGAIMLKVMGYSLEGVK